MCTVIFININALVPFYLTNPCNVSQTYPLNNMEVRVCQSWLEKQTGPVNYKIQGQCQVIFRTLFVELSAGSHKICTADKEAVAMRNLLSWFLIVTHSLLVLPFFFRMAHFALQSQFLPYSFILHYLDKFSHHILDCLIQLFFWGRKDLEYF